MLRNLTNQLTAKTLMPLSKLFLIGWLCTLGCVAGVIVTIVGNDVAAGMEIIAGSILVPITYLLGRVQGVQAADPNKAQPPSPPADEPESPPPGAAL